MKYQLSTLDDVKQLFSQQNINILGLSTFSFDKIILSTFLHDKYTIFAYKDTISSSQALSVCDLSSLGYEFSGSKGVKSILSLLLKDHLVDQSLPLAVFSNRVSRVFEFFCDKEHITILNNSSSLISLYENKKIFRTILKELFIPTLSWDIFNLNDFLLTTYDLFFNRYQSKFVVQLADVDSDLNAGGGGTFFISSQKDFENLHNKLLYTFKDYAIGEIHVSPFIIGKSCSIIGCVTHQGVLVGGVQEQIIDFPYLDIPTSSSGAFCGHSWGLQLSQKIMSLLKDIVVEIGTHMSNQGYKGIFGLDFLFDGENIYILECNPRYTGVFPVLSLIDLSNNCIPLEVFHILEFLKIDYSFDFDIVSDAYFYNRRGSHLILSNPLSHSVTIKTQLSPGVYAYEDGEITYKRPGCFMSDILSNNEFILIINKAIGSEILPSYIHNSRFARVLFPNNMYNAQGTLQPLYHTIVNKLYSLLVSL